VWCRDGIPPARHRPTPNRHMKMPRMGRVKARWRERWASCVNGMP